jgi:ATP-dependent Zn protease
MYGPPGTGKTLLARACAAQTDATFLKLAGPQLVQMFIGDGAKLVRDCFALAKEKAPAIIFIDELDAVGTKRFDSEKSGDREVQRTMLELLNQLDGFASDDRIKVLAATNRVDVLDPALLRSGRLDRKIEFPLPNEEARAQILKIHSRKMTVDDAVNWPELARSTDEFGGAQLKAVCVEAGMIALRMGKNKIGHEHYVDAIAEVQAKKKGMPLLSPTTKLLLTTSRHRQLLRIVLGWYWGSLGGTGKLPCNHRHIMTSFSRSRLGLFQSNACDRRVKKYHHNPQITPSLAFNVLEISVSQLKQKRHKLVSRLPTRSRFY